MFRVALCTLMLVVVARSFSAAHDQDLWSAPLLETNATVLFQGDSITDGGRWRTGNDFNHIMGQDYAYLLAAELGLRHPDRHLTFLNRGISGNRIIDLAARWKEDTIAIKPDFLSILVGVNDTLATGGRAESVDQFRMTYEQLLAETKATLPGTKVMLGEPFLLAVGTHAANFPTEMAQVKQRQEVVRALATKYHLPLVSYQLAFDRACRGAAPSYWSWDGVHPTYAGHALMAEEWLRTATAFWHGVGADRP